MKRVLRFVPLLLTSVLLANDAPEAERVTPPAGAEQAPEPGKDADAGGVEQVEGAPESGADGSAAGTQEPGDTQEPGVDAAGSGTPQAGEASGTDGAAGPAGAQPSDAEPEPAGEAPAGESESDAEPKLTTTPGASALGMSILGNQEAPKALVIVPWKSSEIGDSIRISTILDDSRQPVDKEVFMRELTYYEIRSGTKP